MRGQCVDAIQGRSKTTMQLTVANPDGTLELLEVSVDTTGQEVKEKCSFVKRENEKIRQDTAAAERKAIDEGTPVDPVPEIVQYKLVCVHLGKVLQDECRIGEQGLKEDDKLLLLKQRSAPKPKPENRQPPEEAGPSQAMIDKATKNVFKRNLDQGAWIEKGPGSGMTSKLVQLQKKVAYRQSFITLIEVAHKLLCTDPKATSAVKAALDNARLAAKEMAHIPTEDLEGLQQLQDMCTPETAARKALRAANKEDKDLNDPLEIESDGTGVDNNNSSVPLAVMYEERTARGDAIHSYSGNGASDASASMNASSAKSEADKPVSPGEALHLFQEFRNRPRKAPPEKALHDLQKMGFTKEDSSEALAVNNNNTKTARDWLLGGKTPSFATLNSPLDESCPLRQELVKNPIILVGLTKVKTLLALEQLTHSPEAPEYWLRDQDVGKVLIELSQIISMDYDFEDDPGIEYAFEALDLEDSDSAFHDIVFQ